MNHLVKLCLLVCGSLVGCSATKHDALLVFAFSNATMEKQGEIVLGNSVAEITAPTVLEAFDECVKSSTPTKNAFPDPVANSNWLVIRRGNNSTNDVALHIFADGQISWRYENTQIIDGVLQIKGTASNQVQSVRLAKLIADAVRQTVPDLVKPYDLLNSGDPFAKP